MRPNLPAARGSSQLAEIAKSLVTNAERSNRRVTCLLHIISDVTRVRHAQGTLIPLNPPCVRCLCCCCTNSCACPVWPVLFGALGRCRGALPRTNARCVVAQQNRETKFTATFDQNLPSMKYIFAVFQKFAANIAFGTIF